MPEKESGENRKRAYSVRVIKNAFMELLREKPLGQISVTELCRRADVNRSTFYAIYMDIYDLADQLVDEYYTELSRLADSYPRLDEREFYGKLFTSLKNMDMRDLISSLPDSEKAVHVRSSMHSDVVGTRRREAKDATFLELAYAYTDAGSAEIIRLWVKSGMEIPPEKMAEYLCRLNTAVIGLASPEGEFVKKK